MSDDDDELVEAGARAFCEASGSYLWADTHAEVLRAWYREGARAAIATVHRARELRSPEGGLVRPV
jgi:hypothetical protein